MGFHAWFFMKLPEKELKNERVQDVEAPSISLPKGGGAIRGIGEKFAANPVTGTGSMSVPIATSPGRSEFGPWLSLSYESGAGNGLFGFGWRLSLPSITRKIDKGLPCYLDGAGDRPDSDVFILSDAEDLVPVLSQNTRGDRVIQDFKSPDGNYRIRRYRPRVEGLFARIERWSSTADPTDVHWRSITRDNVLTLYGKDARSRISDPEKPGRIFSWLVCETRDDRGNATIYDYKPEDGFGVDLARAHERNRGDCGSPRRTANRYLKHIYYGNRTPLLDEAGRRPCFLADLPPSQLQNAGWMFQVVMDYGEHDRDLPEPDENNQWFYRVDPFSAYRAGFEVRTTRLCRRVLMFHHFPEEEDVGEGCLVRSTDFTYSHQQDPNCVRNPVYTFLREVMQTSYKSKDGGYLKRSLPPLEFEYALPVVQDVVEDVDPESLENLSVGLDNTTYRWTDLHGEGIPGILTEQGGAWFYKRNLSPLNFKPGDATAVHTKSKLAPVETVSLKPNLELAGGAQFMDLAGDGQPDLVVLDGPLPGFHKHDGEEGWQPFCPFASRLNRDSRDPNLRFIDLSGDGHADVLITEDEAIVWHASLAEEGFGPARRVARVLDEEKGPLLVFADNTQSVYLADFSGDGLTDLVRIRNGEICYWPNLGYGRFGAKVNMDHAPYFDSPDQFDQRRIRLADIDGTGTSDIIYLHREGVRLYFNQSGNSWSEPQLLQAFPRVNDPEGIISLDLLGNGTACLVWSSPLPGDEGLQMRYVNLMGGGKPHLLSKIVNNLGAETHVHYAPSTRFYLQDKHNGKPWITRLPFPVHVVERVETHDRVSCNRFVTRYKYHHGYFDGEEREFRGFGMVEQWDTEEFSVLCSHDSHISSGEEEVAGDDANIEAAFHVPPVHTKTWFHTGTYLDREHISRQFEEEYYREPGLSDTEFRALLLPDTTLPPGLTPGEEREACRALKGMMLRQEVYADDAPPGSSGEMIERAETPYSVIEQDFTICQLQPCAGNRHAVFFTHSREAITFNYERNPADPRIQHTLTLEVDDYGNILKEVAIGYGRRFDATGDIVTPEDRARQRLIHITCTQNTFTRSLDEDTGFYRTPLPAETCKYELRKPEQEKSGNGLPELYRFEDVLSLVQQAGDGQHDVDYEDIEFKTAAESAAHDPDKGEKYFRRLIEHIRTLYRPDDCGAAQNSPFSQLPLKVVDSMALPGESYRLAFTPGLLAQVYQRHGEPLLPNPLRGEIMGGNGAGQGGYVDLDGDGHWWIPSGRTFLSPGDNDTAQQELAHAREHFFLPHRYRDAFGQTNTVIYDDNDLLIVEACDPVGNLVRAENNYRVLQPRLVTDPNYNRTEAAFDVLGMLTATAVMGKYGENEGDLLEDFDPDPSLKDLKAFIANPQGHSASMLGRCTTRIIYDLDRYRRSGQPPFTAALARETHHHDTGGAQTRIQVSFSYSDGFQREIQTKNQAEAGYAPQRQPDLLLPSGDTSPGDLIGDEDGRPVQGYTPYRWAGTGRTVFNNKGKRVKQYEPFFSATHLYEPEQEMTDTGVSPVLFYDPVGRVIATLHPNHTYEKVVLDPWRQETWDVNDTVLENPRRDPDIAGYVGEYFKTQSASWQTWYAQRQGGALGWQEQDAAVKAAAHAGTPSAAYFDSLGRPFLTVACNRFQRSGTVVQEQYPTRVELDIQGNKRAVRDAVLQDGDAGERIVMHYDYSMAGPGEGGEDIAANLIYQVSMEAGERWTLSDVTGNPIRAWDSRGHTFRTEYDPLRRPLRVFVTGANPADPGRELLTERLVYGEQHLEKLQRNLCGQLYIHFDQAGTVASDRYDFKGNPVRSARRIAVEYKQAFSWDAADAALPADAKDEFDPALLEAAIAPVLESDIFKTTSEFDALNRPLTVTTPDNSVYRPAFNEANLLERVDVQLRGAILNGEPDWTPFVTNIDYNARGQRILMEHGSGAETSYKYDPLTFRLIRMKTTRPDSPGDAVSQLFSDPRVVQDLGYSYDPAGNINLMEDFAAKTIYNNGEQVEPACSYTYDSIYRLIEAKGREHAGQRVFNFNPTDGNFRDYPFAGHRQHPHDLQAMYNYTQHYEYDAAGNLHFMRHIAGGGSWNRSYFYEEDSLIEFGKKSNRLSSTTVGTGNPAAEHYTYDAHGNTVTMAHLPLMRWDYRDQLQAVSQQVVKNGGNPETIYYTCDAAGQRVRKVTEGQSAPGRSPVRKKKRIYLGGFEIYREFDGDGAAVELERETLHVMDDQQRIALVETQTIKQSAPVNVPTPLQRYQLGNHLGSASLELDEQARIISCEEYTPYGSSSFQAVSSYSEVSAKRYRYTGKERDEESGFYYHGARYYAPWLGRWTSCDPAGLVDKNSFTYKHIAQEWDNSTDLMNYNARLYDPHVINRYSYVLNNPLRYVDPTGYSAADHQWSQHAALGGGRLTLDQDLCAAFAYNVSVEEARTARESGEMSAVMFIVGGTGWLDRLAPLEEVERDVEIFQQHGVVTSGHSVAPVASQPLVRREERQAYLERRQQERIQGIGLTLQGMSWLTGSGWSRMFLGAALDAGGQALRTGEVDPVSVAESTAGVIVAGRMLNHAVLRLEIRGIHRAMDDIVRSRRQPSTDSYQGYQGMSPELKQAWEHLAD